MIRTIYILILFFSATSLSALAQPQESDYYLLEDIPIPDSIILEVGGMDMLPDGRLAVCTRRGEVWLIDNIYGEQPPVYQRYARGLHEPLGLTYHDGAIYCTQRGEITKLIDRNGDDKADVYETVVALPLTGNYHEYHYGPHFLPNGDMLVTLNLGWEDSGVSKAKWRGWMLRVTPEGEIHPFAAGMRSPAGFGPNIHGDIFYAENQGDWVGSGRITHLEEGDFAGHPASLRWSSEPESPLQLTVEEVSDSLGTMPQAKANLPALKLPAVWFPHGIMGISTAAILPDRTDGDFGPFAGQLLVSDQGQSKIMRVFMEKVNDEYQGICFPFREGYASGLLRLVWGEGGTLFGGMTSRGWRSTGPADYALQRLSWTGKTPFEMKAVRARTNGFEIEFTEPVQQQAARNPALYKLTDFTYLYHSTYGSPVIDRQDRKVTKVTISDDGLRVTLLVDGLRAGYIYEIKLGRLRSASGQDLLHQVGYYTLNHIPGQETAATISTPSSAAPAEVPPQSLKHITAMPADWDGEVDVELVIETAAGMKYKQTYLEVPAGAKVQLELRNPDDMQHNWLLVQPGEAKTVGQMALKMGLDGLANGYVPETDLVLYHTSLVEPGQNEVIYFRAPDVPGIYDYVCTVPGHYQTMRGVLKVLDKGI